MIVVGNAYLSDDLVEKEFVCNLQKCKGACCKEGDLGAPLTLEELDILAENYEAILPFMSQEGQEAVKSQGMYQKDSEGDYSITTIQERECVFAVYDEQGILKCSIENAYKAGKTNFKKPISCHLYPIRITTYEFYEALNYHRWEICSPACELGESLKVPVYQFLKEALIRKYGQEWYEQLQREALLKDPSNPSS